MSSVITSHDTSSTPTTLPTASPEHTKRGVAVLREAGLLVIMVLLVPAAVLLLGAPIALFARLVIELVKRF